MSFCPVEQLVIYPSIFSESWVIASIVLITLVALSSVFSLWLGRVGTPITHYERESGAKRGYLALFSWLLVIIFLVLGLFLLVFPVGCMQQAKLVSAAPVKTSFWDDEVTAFNDRHIGKFDLAVIRDAVLEDIAKEETVVAQLEKISESVRVRLANYDSISKELSFSDKGLDPRVIESAEIAVLMGWHAMFPSVEANQISYLIDDRAENFSWNWGEFEKNNFRISKSSNASGLKTKVIRTNDDEPLLVDVVSVDRLSNDEVKLMLLINDNSVGKLDLTLLSNEAEVGQPKDDCSSVSATKDVVLIECVFDLTSTQVPTSLRQETTQTITVNNITKNRVIDKELPKVTEGIKAFVIAPSVTSKEGVEHSIAFLQGKRSDCNTTTNLDVFQQLPMWKSVFTPQDMSLEVVDDIEDATLIVYLRGDGSLWILSSDVVLSYLESSVSDPIATTLPWLKGKMLSEESLIQNVLSGAPSVANQRMILWKKEVQSSYNLSKISIPSQNSARTVNANFVELLKEDEISATLDISRHILEKRVAFDALSSNPNPIVPVKSRFLTFADSDIEDLKYGSVYAFNLGSLDFTCKSESLNTEFFFSLWGEIFTDFKVINNPAGVSLKPNVTSNLNSPEILLGRGELRRMSVRRVELALLLTFLALSVFVALIIRAMYVALLSRK